MVSLTLIWAGNSQWSRGLKHQTRISIFKTTFSASKNLISIQISLNSNRINSPSITAITVMPHYRQQVLVSRLQWSRVTSTTVIPAITLFSVKSPFSRNNNRSTTFWKLNLETLRISKRQTLRGRICSILEWTWVSTWWRTKITLEEAQVATWHSLSLKYQQYRMPKWISIRARLFLKNRNNLLK